MIMCQPTAGPLMTELPPEPPPEEREEPTLEDGDPLRFHLPPAWLIRLATQHEGEDYI